MAQPALNSFTSYKLTPQERDEAVRLTENQKLYYQTLHSDTAEMILGLRFNPADVLAFTQEESYLRGQLELINFILKQDSAQVLRRSKAAAEDVKVEAYLKGVTQHGNLQ